MNKRNIGDNFSDQEMEKEMDTKPKRNPNWLRRLKLKEQKEMEKQMEKELEKNWIPSLKELDFEEKTKKTIVTIETKEQLNSAVAFAQYLFKDIRLITIIAEKHTKTFSCEKPSITIAEYCKRKILDNPNCKILLEYNEKNDPLQIESHSIRSVFAELKHINKTNHIIPIDIRSDFITNILQNVLYDNNCNEYYKYKPEEIGQKFIEPFFQNAIKFKLDENLYDESIKKFMYDKYYKDILDSFYEAATILRNNGNSRIVLKDTWKKVMDYFILKYILRNDDIDEYIIIVGDAHYNNINTVLSGGDIFIQLNEQNGKNSSDCVKLFQTLRI